MKKLDVEGASDHVDSESDSESSDSSVILSQSEFSSRDYDVDDIKMFLKSMKLSFRKIGKGLLIRKKESLKNGNG